MAGITTEGERPQDEALSSLVGAPGPVDGLVRAYPGPVASSESDWIDSWFRERIAACLAGAPPVQATLRLPDPPTPTTSASRLARPIRLKSLHAHYFRGFRDMPSPIRMDGDLIVVEGGNSSGKTSLAEALEWLLTGRLSRRECQELGHPRELEDCVGNLFRPDGEETWVTAVFGPDRTDDTATITLRRVLKEDYGITRTSACSSVLVRDERELSDEEEREALDTLFASVPPLLMQHTLRLFVQSDPSRRREYFERLLRLDELTDLIQRAVIGEARLPEFRSPSGGASFSTWEMLASLLQTDEARKAHTGVSRARESDLSRPVREALASIARAEFSDSVGEAAMLEEAAAALVKAQAKARRKSFPLLANLRPDKQVSSDVQRATFAEEVATYAVGVREAYEVYASARSAAEALSAAQLAVSQALEVLLEANAIDPAAATQTCPVCEYEPVPTLSAGRITEIKRWAPLREAETRGRDALQKAMARPIGVIRRALQEHDELLPRLPSAAEWDEAEKDASPELRDATRTLRRVREEEAASLEKGLSSARRLLSGEPELPTGSGACEAFISRCSETAEQLARLPTSARRYTEALGVVEAAVGATAGADPEYRLRQAWLGCFDNVTGVADDLRWEQAKRQAQKDLEAIRSALMDYRQRFLDCRRTAFTEEIQGVWSALRSDVYSRFSQLHIPRPRGRGFPVEIEVKAMVDDGRTTREVDALRVFSESQINALGVAAFVTRSKLLGHKVLVLDDPVQSMDEEHFKTFARELLPHMLGQGFQVIVFTHNATFARDVSHWHYDRDGYVTMTVRRSRRHGCVVEEGNRRVPERLSLAERNVEEGNLPEAWRFLRLAIERLYTVVNAKYGPSDFNPDSWVDQAPEYMWNSGAGAVIMEKVPGSQRRLKEILDMTVAGGHDKPARGETDVRASIDYLRELLSTLKVGG
jgi:hypothetical protein